MSESKADISEMDEQTYELAQQVFELVRAGRVAEMKQPLAMGLPANLRNGNGDSLLMLASYNGQYGMTKLLLENDADPELANDRQQTPLAGVAFKGYADIAELLIEYGADVNAKTPDGKTPLMFAAMFNQTAIIDLLLEKGADKHAATEDGKTALILAETMGAEDSMKKLQY